MRRLLGMNIFLTSGTMGFMESLQKKFSDENMIVMHGTGNSILLHETASKTLFQTPQRFEVIASFGTLQKEGFFAFNHIPVTDEGKPIYEHRFQSRADTISEEPGLIALRFLRPMNSDTYIIFTQWTEKRHFELWKKSPIYASVHIADESGVGLDKRPHIFTSAPYVTTYKSKEDKV